MSFQCDVLHPFFRSKCILLRNHLEETHVDAHRRLWVNQKILVDPETLVALFRAAADQIEY